MAHIAVLGAGTGGMPAAYERCYTEYYRDMERDLSRGYG